MMPASTPRSRAVALGASAGGGLAIRRVLRDLPASYPLPILIVHHIAEGGSALQAELMSNALSLDVREARSGEPISSGKVYLAPANYHLLVEADYHLALADDERVSYSRPSIDVLLESAADVYGAGLIAILLTGANRDGAVGMLRARERGALTIVQDPVEAEFPTMPATAIELLARTPTPDHHLVLRLADIAALLARHGDSRQASSEAHRTPDGRP